MNEGLNYFVIAVKGGQWLAGFQLREWAESWKDQYCRTGLVVTQEEWLNIQSQACRALLNVPDDEVLYQAIERLRGEAAKSQKELVDVLLIHNDTCGELWAHKLAGADLLERMAALEADKRRIEQAAEALLEVEEHNCLDYETDKTIEHDMPCSMCCARKELHAALARDQKEKK